MLDLERLRLYSLLRWRQFSRTTPCTRPVRFRLEGGQHCWSWEALEGGPFPAAGLYRVSCGCGWEDLEELTGAEVWLAQAAGG